MAAIKQAFSAFPIIIVSHTAKILGSQEASNLGPRGASAWTGDAQGVYAVFKDGEDADAPRVLKAVKVRFPAAYPELVFELVSNRERHPDVLGTPRDIWFAHAVARPLKAGERTALKTQVKEERERTALNALTHQLIRLIRDNPNRARSYFERLATAEGGLKCSQERRERLMNSLLADGLVERIELEKPQGRANHYVRVNEELVAQHYPTEPGSLRVFNPDDGEL
jgi:hypothetical protein